MTLSQWLDSKEGRATAMAAHFGVSKAAISQWRRGAPVEKLRDLVSYCEGEVSLTDLLTDIEQRKAQA